MKIVNNILTTDFGILTENNVNYGFDFNEELTFEFIDEMGFSLLGPYFKNSYLVLKSYTIINRF